jgi:zinc finger CCHC domain-containing protein 9
VSQECPQNDKADGGEGKLCYRCGRIDHSLKECKKSAKRDEGEEVEFLPFAKCYICSRTGHLASLCPDNEHGLFPDGGGCKLCGTRPGGDFLIAGATDHLKKQCPQKDELEKAIATVGRVGVDNPDEDGYHEKLRGEVTKKRRSAKDFPPRKKKPKVVVF